LHFVQQQWKLMHPPTGLSMNYGNLDKVAGNESLKDFGEACRRELQALPG
jgi:hypothetical protein